MVPPPAAAALPAPFEPAHGQWLADTLQAGLAGDAAGAMRAFRDALARGRERLMALAKDERTAVMCAEAPWWRCHRSLISDDFKARGWQVIHLMNPGRSQEHPWTPVARIVDGKLDYSSPADDQSDLFL